MEHWKDQLVSWVETNPITAHAVIIGALGGAALVAGHLSGYRVRICNTTSVPPASPRPQHQTPVKPSEPVLTPLLQGRILAHAIRSIQDWAPRDPIPNLVQFKRGNHLEDMRYNEEIGEDEVVLATPIRGGPERYRRDEQVAFVRAGPRPTLYFRKEDVRACIVTCGGLCPGLNNVVQEIVLTLYHNYGVRSIFGVRYGYQGIYNSDRYPWLELNPSIVRDIGDVGGTILGSSRGGFDLEKIVTALIDNNINQLYLIGGDGTHRGAKAIADEVEKRRLAISVVGVPKTVDNDIGLIDRSFGFNTTIGEASRAVQSVRVEARGVHHGVGLVKLMGRNAGFIAAHTTCAAGGVDLCLVPESKFTFEGVTKYIEAVLRDKGHAVIVVAEGAGQELLADSGEVDASHNKKLSDIGDTLKQYLTKHLADTGLTPKPKVVYNAPAYMIRSVPAMPSDAMYCFLLADNAVHGAMGGLTGFSSCLVANRTAYIPLEDIASHSPRQLNVEGRTWERVLSITRQPRRCVVDEDTQDC